MCVGDSVVLEGAAVYVYIRMRSSVALVILISTHILIVGAGRNDGKGVIVPKPGISESRFYSQQNKNGSIKSPDYPYWSSTETYRKYIFHGEEYELVQITFENFNLYKKDDNVECTSEDSRLVFTRRESIEIALCGQTLPLPILADNRHFIMQFWHAGRSNYIDESQLDGFNATYRFVTNFGIESGRPVENQPCQFEYDSEFSKNGTIYSPNFPGPYLWSMECIYYFRGVEPYIRLEFSNFSLFGSDDCLGDDYVEIKASADDAENFFYEKLCGTREKPFEINVNSSVLFVVFHSSDRFFSEGQQSQRSFVGFNAAYFFSNETRNLATDLKLESSLLLGSLFIWSWKMLQESA